MDAFLEVYESSFDALYRYVLSRTGNHDDADDIVSDAYLRVFHRYRHVTDKEQLRRLLFVTARNLVIHQSRRVQPVALPVDCPSGEGQDATAEIVQDALAALEPDEQDLIALKYFSRLTFHEVSEILGINERTVQSRLRLGFEECDRRTDFRRVRGTLYDGLTFRLNLERSITSGTANVEVGIGDASQLRGDQYDEDCRK